MLTKFTEVRVTNGKERMIPVIIDLAYVDYDENIDNTIIGDSGDRTYGVIGDVGYMMKDADTIHESIIETLMRCKVKSGIINAEMLLIYKGTLSEYRTARRRRYSESEIVDGGAL